MTVRNTVDILFAYRQIIFKSAAYINNGIAYQKISTISVRKDNDS